MNIYKPIFYSILLTTLAIACSNRTNKKPVKLQWSVNEGINLTDSIHLWNLFDDIIEVVPFSDGQVWLKDLKEGYYKIRYDDDDYNHLRYTVYLIPGSKLSISIATSEEMISSGSSSTKTTFSGDLADAANYLMKVDDLWTKDFWRDTSKTISDALITSSKSRKKHEALLAKLSSQGNERFMERELRSIVYRYHYQRNHKKANYQSFSAHHNEPMGIIPDFAQEGFPETDEEYNILTGKDHFILGYIDLADRIMENKCKYLSGNQSVSKGVYAMNLLSKFSDGKLKDYLTKKYYRLYRTPIIPDRAEMDEIYQLAISNISDSAYKVSLNEIYKDAKKMAPGVPAPSFNLLNHHDKMVSLEDLRGSYVYMDIWAVFCAPCKREIPYLKKLEEDYKDANIKFVSVTLDDLKRKEKWVKFVKDKELGGIHLMADENFRDDVKNLYQNMFIPRYALIDPTGRFVSAKAAPPSSPNIRVLFDKLLTM